MLNENEPRLSMFTRRLVAYCIDVALLCLLCLVLRMFIDELMDPIVVSILLNTISLCYFSILEASPWQATIGKRLLRLVVVDMEENRLSLLRAVWRNVARYLNFFIFSLGYLTLFFTKHRQCMHDLFSRTCVVRGVMEAVDHDSTRINV